LSAAWSERVVAERPLHGNLFLRIDHHRGAEGHRRRLQLRHVHQRRAGTCAQQRWRQVLRVVGRTLQHPAVVLEQARHVQTLGQRPACRPQQELRRVDADHQLPVARKIARRLLFRLAPAARARKQVDESFLPSHGG
jgi:hypothetical protein